MASYGVFCLYANFSASTGISFRLDHNTFDAPNGTWGRFFELNYNCVSPGCLIDHNVVTNAAAEIGSEVNADRNLTYPGTATSCSSPDNCAGFTG